MSQAVGEIAAASERQSERASAVDEAVRRL
jgi:hypothetical protein